MSGALELNFHHLRYFWAVAKDGNLTRAAERLRVSQSALSSQIRQLEDELGEPLFRREARRLELTEAGKIAYSYAEEIFATGTELVTALTQGRPGDQRVRVGVVPGLSPERVRTFVKPLLGRPEARVELETGALPALLEKMDEVALELVLSNRPAPRGERKLKSRRLSREPVVLVARWKPGRFRFPKDLAQHGLLVPGKESELRTDFDALCAEHDVVPRIVAEVEDVAALVLMARDSDAVALVPASVAAEAIAKKQLYELATLNDVAETMYVLTVDREYQHPLVKTLL